MTDWLGGLLWSCQATAVVAVLLFFPGFWLARRLCGGDDLRVLAVLSLLVSLVLEATITAVLLAVGTFDPRLLAVAAIVAAIPGVASVIRWQKTIPRQTLLIGAVCALVVAMPWVAAVARPDFPPSNTLQWYYWNLGRALSDAGRLPLSVSQFGQIVVWPSNYVLFNAISEGYSTLMAPAGPAAAIQAWRVPIALAGLGSTYLLARLWLDRFPAVIAAAATGATGFFLVTFGTYTPESLGIVASLLAAWLAVMGWRERRAPWIAVAAVVLGGAAAIHATSAAIAGIVVIGIAVAERVTSDEDRRRRLGWLAGAAVLGLVVMIATTALQDAAQVGSGTLRPTTGGLVDPRWTYLQYSNGVFREHPQPTLFTQLARAVREPWPGVRLGTLGSLWLVWLVGLGLVFAAGFGDRRLRIGIVAGFVGVAVLGAAFAFFALASQTYVPQDTGPVAFARYVPAGLGLAVGFASQGYLLAWKRITQSSPPPGFIRVAAALALAWLVVTAQGRYASDLGIPTEGRAALAELARDAEPGDVVLSNALTTGQLEFFADVEAPLEGRQPLIGPPALLDQANAQLLAARRFFGPNHDPGVLETLDVRWLLVADQPGVLGAGASLGGNVAEASSDPRLALRWGAPGVALFEVLDLGQ